MDEQTMIWHDMGLALALAINKLGVGRFRAINWGLEIA